MSAPAPDKYEVPVSITKDGVYQQSKWTNSRAPRISTTTGDKFKDFNTNIKNPAPGHYDAIAGLDNKGVYKISKHKNSLCRSFSQAARNTLGIDISKKDPKPGPGQYRLPSEFGHYISSRAGLAESQSAKQL